MGTRIFVGNLSYGSTEESIRQHFEQFGIPLKSARIIMDRDTGRSRGFAFAELADESQMAKAVQELDGSMLEGRPLAVREAHDRPGPSGPPGAPRGGGFERGPRPGGFGGPGPAVESRRPFGDSAPPRREPTSEGDGPSGPGRGYGGGPPRPSYGGGGGGGGYGGGGGGYAGGGGGGGGPSGGRSFSGPPPSSNKKKPKNRDREDEGGRGRFDGEKRRRGFHGGRGYTEYEDDDE